MLNTQVVLGTHQLVTNIESTSCDQGGLTSKNSVHAHAVHNPY